MEENTTMIITSIAALVLAGTLIWAFISITKANSKKMSSQEIYRERYKISLIALVIMTIILIGFCVDWAFNRAIEYGKKILKPL